jgi:hypothetical protein
MSAGVANVIVVSSLVSFAHSSTFIGIQIDAVMHATNMSVIRKPLSDF